MWIGTNNGLYFYDRFADAIVKQDLLDKKKNKKSYNVQLLLENSEGNMWIESYDNEKKVFSVGFFNTTTKDFIVFSNKEKGPQYLNLNGTLSLFFIDKQDRLWIGWENNLLKYTKAEKKFKPIYFDTSHRKIA